MVAHAEGGFVISGRNVAHKRDHVETHVLLEPASDEQFFNDLVADRTGRVFVGSVGRDIEGSARAPGRLYRIDIDGSVVTLADDVLVSNGLGTNPAGDILYHVDTYRHTIWRFDLTSSTTCREIFASTTQFEGVPDGLAVGADGSVWVAMAGGSAIVGWKSSGEVITTISVPHRLTTSLCFGGPALDVLFILTGSNTEYPDPDGGCVYSTQAPVKGLESPVARIASP